MLNDLKSFRFTVGFESPPERVFEAFWNLADWPAVAPHVRDIEMHFEDDEIQVLTMHVETRGRRDAFRTVRVRQGASIYFIQPRPPALLRRHWGWWHVLGTGAGTEVHSEHTLEPDPAEAERFLRSVGIEPASADDVVERLLEIIRGNSRQTMVALKERLEREAATAGAPAAAGRDGQHTAPPRSGERATPVEGGVE